MAVSEDATLVDFDADAASTVRDAADDGVHLCVEYTPEEFHVLYADETTLERHGGDREEMVDHVEEVHSYVHVDFTERDLFVDLLRGVGDVRSFVTRMDRAALIRVLVGQQGLFLTADPDADVTRIVETVESRLG